MTTDKNPYEEGKRAGLHPLIVIFGAILIMWLLINLAVPSGKQKQATGPEISQVVIEDPDAAPVMFKVQATLTEFNAVSIVVPAQVTTSQVVGLLKQFKQARLDQNLPSMLPATSPGHKLGDQAVADLYIFQTPSMRRLTSWAPWHAEPMLRATSTPRRFLSKRRWNRCAAITASI